MSDYLEMQIFYDKLIVGVTSDDLVNYKGKKAENHSQKDLK